jgi:CBS domain containing-hemolysin-like protein
MGFLSVLGVMVALLLIKGFFSGSEIALVSADKIQMRHRARVGDKGARLLLKMFRKPDRLLTTTLVGTNLATVALTTIGTIGMVLLFGERGDLYAFLLFTPILLIFGEIVPKSIYQQKAEGLAPVIVYPLRAAMILFFPVVFLFSQMARFATRVVGAGKAAQSVFLTREQLRAVLEMTERRSDVASFNRGRIRRAIRFSDTPAADVMTPLRDMTLFDADGDPQKLAALAQRSGYRPIPVYQENTQKIIGMVSLTPWDLMKMEILSSPVTDLSQPAYYAAPQQTLGELLPILRKREDQAAIIVDEFGSAIGMLTVEDILEVVVGEVKVGYHFEKHRYSRKPTLQTIEDRAYLLDARLPISDVNDLLGLNLPHTEYRTIGGMLLSHLRHIPQPGEFVVDSGYRFTVEEATEKEVVTVRAQPEG